MTKTLFRIVIILISFVGVSAQVNGEPADISVPDGGVTLPMELFAGKPVVEVKINGQGPFRLFLDTGAGATVLDQDLADELKLTPDGTTRLGDPSNPQAIEAKRNQIAKLELGGATLGKFVAVSFDRSALYRPGAPRGVLGIPLFRKLLLTIDYPGSKVGIKRGVLPAADGKTILDVKLGEGGIFRFQLDVGGKMIASTFDTGAQSAISFPESYASTVPLKSKPVEIGRGRTVGGEAIITAAKYDGQIRIGSHTWTDPEVRFFSRLTGPNVGYALLSSFSVTIDQQNWRIRLDGTAKPLPETPARPTAAAAATATGPLATFAGTFGERAFTTESGDLHVQRLTGPQGMGPKMKLVQIAPGEFALDGEKEVRFKFQRNETNEVIAVAVLTPAGKWETTTKAKAAQK